MEKTGKTPQQLLRDAADLIEQKGWCQRAYSDGNGYCAIGALLHIDHNDISRSYLSATHSLEANIGSIATWNDQQERTKQEVIAKLREVAQLTEVSQ